MDLLVENRSLIYTGKLLRQPDTGFEWSGWSELFVLLFDNYCRPLPLSFAEFMSTEWIHSCHDEAERKGWSYKISCLPPRTSLPC